jgi:hypothetical protein
MDVTVGAALAANRHILAVKPAKTSVNSVAWLSIQKRMKGVGLSGISHAASTVGAVRFCSGDYRFM